MEKRNAIAIVGIVAFAVFILYFAARGGAIPDPFIKYLNVKAVTSVECGAAWMCWFTNEIKEFQATPGFKYSLLKPMQWYCGIGKNPTPIKATLTTENPDGSTNTFYKEEKVCEAKDVTFRWNMPLNKGVGTYRLSVEICGSTYWHQFICKEKITTYNFAG